MITAIFDLDGTLADTLCDLGDAVNHGLKVMGCPVHSYEEYRNFVGNGAMKLCERALPEGKKDKAGELHELFKEYYGEHFLDNTKIYKGMKQTLEKLQDSGVVLAVATNKPEKFAVMLMDELLPEIDFIKVLGGRDDRPKKPDTAILIDIFSALPDTENHVYMIGDSNVDVQTGHNAGIEVIGCAWGFRGRDELEREGADYIAEAPGDIAEIILG